MKKLISVDMHAQFGHLKKNDMNEGLSLTYTYLHKPALLGIFGSIVGLGGYSQAYIEQESVQVKRGEKRAIRLPEYYRVFQHLRLSIGLPDSARGTFLKTVIGYNNAVGYANDGATLQVREQTLIKPTYRVYVELDIEQEAESKLYASLRDGHCEFIPYLGKNEFTLDWDNFTEYQYQLLTRKESINIATLFIRNEATVKQMRKVKNDDDYDYESLIPDDVTGKDSYMFLESLPHSYHPQTGHYVIQQFAYTSWKMKLEEDSSPQHLYEVLANGQSTVIQFI